MKKPMKQQLNEIIKSAEEQLGVENMPEELKNIKVQIKSLLKIMNLFMVVMIVCTAVFFVSSIVNLVSYIGVPDTEAATELGESILALISSAAWLIVTIICKNIFADIDKSSTPFIPQVPKGIRRIAVALIIMFLISAAEQLLYPIFTGIEPKLVIDGTSMIFVSVLVLLSYIFDYGCKLQQESDETI